MPRVLAYRVNSTAKARVSWVNPYTARPFHGDSGTLDTAGGRCYGAGRVGEGAGVEPMKVRSPALRDSVRKRLNDKEIRMTGMKAGTSKKAQLRAARGLPEPQKCKRIKRNGERCGNAPILGATVCRMHGGSAPQVRKKAAERLAAHADILMAALLKIAASAESEAVRLSAVRDALDRAGFGAAQMLKLVPGDDPWSHLLEKIMDEDVLVRVTDRALPPPNPDGGRATDDDDEDYTRNAVQTVEYTDNDSMEWEELSLDRPGTLRGEVIRDYGPQASAAPGDANRPPKYLRDALEEEGVDWREPGRRRGTSFTP